MLSVHRLVSSRSLISTRILRTLFTPSFSLDKAWAARHNDLNKLGLGGDYEWIASVQKKFIGGGVASAVDVDAAVCIAEHQDQVDDVVDLVYKLRHSSAAADLLPSTEYALLRLLLKHDAQQIIKLANDPINYGVFLNEHTACLSIEHFLEKEQIPEASLLAAWVMQQEMTTNELLNLTCLYTVAKWAELPLDQQVMPLGTLEDEEEINEEDIKTIKFPWLKNEYHDGHFDLAEPSKLAGKTLLWIAEDSKNLADILRSSARFLGAILYNDLKTAASIAKTESLNPGVSALVKDRIEAEVKAQGEEAKPTEYQQHILDAISAKASPEESALPFSVALLEALKKLQSSEEEALTAAQTKEFSDWASRRQQLVDAQAERVLLKVKLEDINGEIEKLNAYVEKLSFFENRLMWEKKAEDNDKIEPVEGKKRATS